MGLRLSPHAFSVLRIALPAVIVGSLAGAAIWLGAPAEQADSEKLLTTASTATPSPTNTASRMPTRSPDPSIPSPLQQYLPDFTISRRIVVPPAKPSAAANAIDVEECNEVNGYIVTVVDGRPTCQEILSVANDYTTAILAQELGRELQWSGKGWQCVRNYDATGVTANARGLICIGNGAFHLVYDESGLRTPTPSTEEN
jgi:hypothetical protein